MLLAHQEVQVVLVLRMLGVLLVVEVAVVLVLDIHLDQMHMAEELEVQLYLEVMQQTELVVVEEEMVMVVMLAEQEETVVQVFSFLEYLQVKYHQQLDNMGLSPLIQPTISSYLRPLTLRWHPLLLYQEHSYKHMLVL